MNAHRTSTEMGWGRGTAPFPRSHPQKQNAAVYTKVWTHLRCRASGFSYVAITCPHLLKKQIGTLRRKGQVLGRLGDLAPGIRLEITKDCFRMFAHRPVLGWGLGAFPTVYPSYRTFYTNYFINEAHNDYAQLLVETGLLGFALMLWFLVRLYGCTRVSSRRWEFKWDGALSLAALLGCTGILFHSFVDFNLQIPANAAFFYVLAALAASELAPRSSRSGRTKATETKVGELSGE